MACGNAFGFDLINIPFFERKKNHDIDMHFFKMLKIQTKKGHLPFQMIL